MMMVGGTVTPEQLDEEQLRLLKAARNVSGLPLDFWEDLTDGLDHKCLAILCGRASMFPKYIKSRESP